MTENELETLLKDVTKQFIKFGEIVLSFIIKQRQSLIGGVLRYFSFKIFNKLLIFI